MKTINDFLKLDRTVTEYLFDGLIDWDVVSDADKDMLVEWALSGEDAGERWEAITTDHGDAGEFGELLVAVAMNDLTAAAKLAEYTRRAALSYVMELCDRAEQAAVLDQALSDYAIEYETAEQHAGRMEAQRQYIEYLR